MGSVFRPALLLMAGRAVAFGGTFLIPVALVRVFEPAAFGAYKQLTLLHATLFAVAQLGMAESLFYFLPRSAGAAGRYVANSLGFLALAGLLCLALLHSGAAPAAAWLGGHASPASITLVACFLAFTLAAAPLEPVMISRKRYVSAALAYGVSDLARAGFLILPALALRRLEAVFAGAAAFGAARLALALLYVRREFPGRLQLDARALREQLAYALPFGAAGALALMQASYHQWAVASLFDAASFAIYSVGCTAIPLVELVAGPTGNVLMVRLAEETSAGRRRAALLLWHETTRRMALVFVPLVGLLLVTGRDLIALLFTESYLASVPVFLVWTTSVLSATLLTDAVLRVFADNRFLLASYALRLGLNAVLLAVLVRPLQLVGAVVATVAAEVVVRAIGLRRVARRLGVGMSQALPWGRLLGIGAAGAVACAPALLAAAAAGPSLPLRLAAAGSAYALAYGLLLWLPGPLSAAERGVIAGWLRRASRLAWHRPGQAGTT
jgi:O-antigen/teichoic acid export membrane protein